MFMGDSYALNLNAINQDGDPPQYPELGLGYSAPTSPPAGVPREAQWWRR